jgi:hypothetical protein
MKTTLSGHCSLLVLDVNTRVAHALVRKHSLASRKPACVLVKHNLALVLDKLALFPDTEGFGPCARSAFVVVSGGGKTGFQVARGFPAIIIV